MVLIATSYLTQGSKEEPYFFISYLILTLLFFVIVFRPLSFNLPTYPLLPFFLFFIWVGISLFSFGPLQLFLSKILRLFSFVLFGLCISFYAKEKICRIFPITLIVLALIESTIVLYHTFHNEHRLGLLTPNQIYPGILIGTAFIALIFLFNNHKSTLIKLGVVTASTILFVSIYFLSSRTVMLGLAFTICCSIFIKKHRTIPLLFLPLILFFLISNPEAVMKFFRIDYSNLSELTGRFVIWKTALLAIFNRPFLGFGLGNFESAYFLFQQPENELLRYAKHTSFAHNEFLQYAVEAGLPALIFIVWGIYRLFKSLDFKKLNWMQWWATMGLVFFIACSFFNFTTYLPLHGFILSGCIGILIGTTDQTKTININLYKSSFSAFILFFLLMSLGLSISEVALAKERAKLSIAAFPLNAKAWEKLAWEKSVEMKSIRYINQSLLYNSSDSFTWISKAKLLMKLQPQFPNFIEEALNQATLHAPKHAPHWIQRGDFYLRNKKIIEAEACFKTAIELEPRAPRAYNSLANLYLIAQRTEDASPYKKIAQDLYNEYGFLSKKSNYARYLFEFENEL